VWGSHKLGDGINELVLGLCKLVYYFSAQNSIDQELKMHTEKLLRLDSRHS